MTDECAYRGKLIATTGSELVYDCLGSAFAGGKDRPCGKGEARYDGFGRVCRVRKIFPSGRKPQYMD